LTSAATLLLIWAGGLVTSLGAGLAVPDWPTTFGYNMFLFPWSQMVGGIFIEHSHRLLGSLVGFLTILAVASLWLFEERKWLRWLGAAALFLVILQGVLGGLRVLLIKLNLAIVHACLAQLFFGLMVGIALLTSRGWSQGGEAPEALRPGRPALGRLALATLVLIYLQTILGAYLRHTGERLDAHLAFAAAVTVHVIWLAAKVIRECPERKEAASAANALWILLVIQLALGAGSFLGKYADWTGPLPLGLLAAITSAHVVVGSLLFAAALVLLLWLRRADAPEWASARADLLSGRSPA